MAISCSIACSLLSISSSSSTRNHTLPATAKLPQYRTGSHSRAWPSHTSSHICSPSSLSPNNRGSRKGQRHRGIVCVDLRESAATTAVAETAKKDCQLLVDNLLALVADTDRGATLCEEVHMKVSEIVDQLEQFCIPEPLLSPLIFAEWDVEYSSNPTASGGYYRSTIGRALLKTKEMLQIITPPDVVENKVLFSLFGLFDGKVSLKGKLRALENNWIEVTFDSPSLLLGSMQFQYGGSTKVKIAVLYLDERIRLGRGSRGSIFVFKRH